MFKIPRYIAYDVGGKTFVYYWNNAMSTESLLRCIQEGKNAFPKYENWRIEECNWTIGEPKTCMK